MKTYSVFTSEEAFLPGSQRQPTRLPREFVGTVEANSSLQAKRKAEEKYPDVHSLTVEPASIKSYLASIGSKGGKSTSEAKKEAARANGAKRKRLPDSEVKANSLYQRERRAKLKSLKSE